MLFRQQTRHASAPNTTASMTDVFYYGTATITTALVVDESLGIYPTVEGCGVPGPFYQNFRSLVTPAKDGLNSIRLALRYDDLLEFRLVERTVQFITVPIDQTTHGWVGSVRVNNRKQLFCRVRHVSISKCCFALLMRTGSPTLNLGVPPLSSSHNRCHTVSWLVLLTSDVAIPILRW